MLDFCNSDHQHITFEACVFCLKFLSKFLLLIPLYFFTSLPFFYPPIFLESLKCKDGFIVLGIGLRPVQTLATLLANKTQHCWAQHVASVCTPCCVLLCVVACCCDLLDEV